MDSHLFFLGYANIHEHTALLKNHLIAAWGEIRLQIKGTFLP